MAHMSGNEKCFSGNFGDSSQLTNCILDSGATCHMKPEVSYFFPGSLEYTDKKNWICGWTSRHSETKGISMNKNVRR